MNNVVNSLLMQQFNSFCRNPMSFLLQKRLNVPNDCMNNPKDAVQYLLDSGQISEQQIESAKSRARSLGINI